MVRVVDVSRSIVVITEPVFFKTSGSLARYEARVRRTYSRSTHDQKSLTPAQLWARRYKIIWAFSLAVLLSLCFIMSGCASGGYAGTALESLSKSSIALDAGQSTEIAAQPANSSLTWALSGSTCSGASCGTLSASTGATVTYSAPAGVTSPLQVVLQGVVPGTSSGKSVNITVNPVPAIMGNLPSGVIGTAYSASLPTSGGTSPATLSLSAGSLPPGLSFNATSGSITGIPTTTGTYTVTFQATDSSDVPDQVTATRQISITAPGTPALAISGNPPSGSVGTPYSTALTASGGTQPYTWTVSGGALPAGLTLAPGTGIFSGTPTVAGTSMFTVQAEDASGAMASDAFSVNITGGPAGQGSLGLAGSSLPGATVGAPYSATVGVAGGTAPYSCILASGTLPAGLTLNSNCVVSGTPTMAGTATATVKATDSSNPTQTTTGTVSITVAPGPLSLTGSLPNGTAGTPYSAPVSVTGGTAPYTCTLASGTLPAGLTLNSNCVISGTPTTAGTATATVKATDSSNPAQTTAGTVSITVAPTALSLTGALPNGAVGAPYSSPVGVTGGTAPYSCALASGTLPAGLTLNANCVISGTPTTAGTSTATVKATDSGNPAQTATGPASITVAPSGLSVTGNLPNGSTGTPYSAPIGVAGGTAPYSCALASGTLPAGLTLNVNCVVSGTPTTAGASTATVKATDSSNPAQTATGPVSITVTAPPVLTISSPPAGMVGSPYTGTVGVTGGTGPYTCVVTAGTINAGLTLANNCQVTGTPTTAGAANLTVQATDSSSPSRVSTGPVTITVNPASANLTLGTPATATVGTPYTGAIPVAGGTAPYSCTINSGTLPAGLALGAGCALTGTPTTAGTSSVNVTAMDSAKPAATTTGPVIITVQPIPALTLNGSLPNGVVGQAYTQTLHATGGVAPYTYATTSGALPAGLALSPGGVISGTPTTPGASSFTVTATDSEGTPQTASLPLVLLVTYATTGMDALLTGPYAFLFQGYDDVTAGVLAYQTATVGSFTADGSGVISAGELDANHQASAPTGNTVASQKFLGTYTVGTDGRGNLTLTLLNADGTTATTSTYAIALHAPAAPSTIAAQGTLIEADNNQLAGTRGSGTLLAQTPAAFANGLQGSYAFGVSGDTPCLPTCTLGITAGPVASVGQFTTAGAGVLSGGSSDTNIAATPFANSAVSGTYSAADGNGRVQLVLTQASLPAGIYPADYAAYLVDANHVFLMSTDKHSAYILQAGSAQLQTQTSFSTASLSGNYVGYENSPVNPGLVGQTLQNVLNLSTSTVFEGTADGAGNCVTNAVDTAGTTGVINTLTGLGGSVTTLQAALGSFDATGKSTCTVAANGRTVLNYAPPSVTAAGIVTITGAAPAPRVAYLYGTNAGYFLETSYAGLGTLEDQEGSPYTQATLDGTYVYTTIPASSLATTNSSGTFTADGKGDAQTTLDMNVGVGTINVIQLGVTSSFTYTLTNATEGRFLLNPDTVIYAITPNRFVLLDEDPLITSPSVALLY